MCSTGVSRDIIDKVVDVPVEVVDVGSAVAAWRCLKVFRRHSVQLNVECQGALDGPQLLVIEGSRAVPQFSLSRYG